MLPNVAQVLSDFEQDITLKTVTTTTVNFVPQRTVVSSTIKAVVEVAKPTDLRVEQINTALRYLKIHSTSQINIDNYVFYSGKNYRVIEVSNWADYGYYRVFAEEYRETLP